MSAVPHSRSRFERFAWFVLLFNLAVIVWGAFVRASGSGAGCGSHWPLCNGQVVPRAPQIQTAIEYAHRFSSGLCLIFSAILATWAWRIFPKGNWARRAAITSLGFTLTEALLGAALVLFGYVAHDQSVGRAVSICLHLVNTLFLVGSLTLTARWSHGTREPRFADSKGPWMICGFSLALIVALGMTGALTALGDTLFHSASLAAGLQQDFRSGSHFLLRLRVIHPFLAVGVGAFLYAFSELCLIFSKSEEVEFWARLLKITVFAQLALGGVNLLLLAPTAIQLLHLLLADLIWVSAILLSAATLETARAATPFEALTPESFKPLRSR